MIDAWATFLAISEDRRAVRDFTGEPVADEDMRAILAAAQLAPSSSNTQPYELHWVRDSALRARVAEACQGQRAAQSAGALVVVVARWAGVPATYDRFLAHVGASDRYDEKARAYHWGRKREMELFAGRSLLASVLRLIAGTLGSLFALVSPHFLLLPFGRRGAHHWAARNSIFAAQTLLLAASARGLDSCPMEGFNPWRVARLLGVKGAVIPLVIALGRRREDASIEPRWRRALEDAVVVH